MGGHQGGFTQKDLRNELFGSLIKQGDDFGDHNQQVPVPSMPPLQQPQHHGGRKFYHDGSGQNSLQVVNPEGAQPAQLAQPAALTAPINPLALMNYGKALDNPEVARPAETAEVKKDEKQE